VRAVTGPLLLVWVLRNYLREGLEKLTNGDGRFHHETARRPSTIPYPHVQLL